MIVKFQISQFDSEGRTRMLIYDETRRYKVESDATETVLEKMKGQPKKFFHATLKDKQFQVGNEAPWQHW